MILAAAVLATQLDAYLAPYAKRGALAVAVVRDGRVEAVRTYGAKPDAAFRMASLSKVVTALAVIRSGADLDALTRYGVTLRQLITHTGGIDDAFFGNTVAASETVTLAEHFRRRPPRFGRRAGEVVAYSNEGMTLAGHLIENGTPFEEVVRRTVFAPLGMTRSTFVQPPPFEVVPSGEEHARLVQVPAGAMVSTASDMARLMLALLPDVREQRYGMFEHGGAFFHTGRSGHESVVYLDPERRLGLFLVHTGGLGPELRRNFVRDFGGWRTPPPSDPRIAAGTYRPLLLPRHRIESAAHVATDAAVRVDGSRVTVRLPPFALGQTLVFERGVSKEGYVLTGSGSRFTIAGPLREPVTFERVRISGRMKLIAAALAFLVMLAGGRRFVLAALLYPLAPVAFLAGYLPRGAETRPFHVASSIHLALAVLVLAAAVAPFLAWKARGPRQIAAAAAALVLAGLVVHVCLLPLL